MFTAITPILWLASMALAGPLDPPFEKAACVPADVHVYLHIDRPGELRGTFASTALADAMSQALPPTAIDEAWKRLAEAARMDESALFDQLLGENLTLVIRRDPQGPYAWAAVSLVNDGAWAALSERLAFRVLASRGNVVVRELPEHQLLFARLGRMVIIGPDPGTGPSLFDACLDAASGERALEGLPAIAQARALGEGDIGLFIRHEAPLGGWSAVVADIEGPTISLKHASCFAESPFGAPVAPVSLSQGLLDQLSAQPLLTIVQPREASEGTLSTFVRSQLPAGALTPRAIDNLGERVVLLMDGSPDASSPGELQVAVAIEVKSSRQSLADLDSIMGGMVQAMGRYVPRGEAAPDAGKMCELGPEAVRSIKVGSAAKRMFPNLPGAADLSLHWQVANGPNGNWWVISTGSDLLKTARCSLTTPLVLAGERIEFNGQAGLLTGHEAAHHVDRLGAHLVDLADPSERAQVHAVARALAALLEGTDTVDWRAEVGEDNTISSSWLIRLREESVLPSLPRTVGGR